MYAGSWIYCFTDGKKIRLSITQTIYICIQYFCPVKTTMDKFEETAKMMAKMPPAEMMKAIEMKKEMCTCPKCPTYTNCAKNAKELLFCNAGKSFMCISDEKGCICPTCPVAMEMGLKHKFFCTKGSEKAQRYEGTLWGTKMV